MLAGVLSVVAAFAYTCGLALQQKANLETPTSSAGLAATVRRVVLNRWWLGGFGLGVAGFVVHGVALALGIVTTAMAVVGVVILARSAASMAIAESTEQQTAP